MLLVLPGTIYVNGTKQAKLINTEERLSQYISSIKFFADQKVIDKIVFCDNSNYSYDYSELIKYCKDRSVVLELLRYQDNNEIIQKKGKGYGEGRIMEYIFDHSLLMKTESYFFKVTGRLTIDNFKEIVDKMDLTDNYFFIGVLRKFQIIDTRFYYVNKMIYNCKLRDAYKNVEDCKFHYLEMCFRDALNVGKVPFKSFPEYPIISGFSGTKGIKYENKGLLFKWHQFSSKLGFHNTWLNALIMYLILFPTAQIEKLKKIWNKTTWC